MQVLFTRRAERNYRSIKAFIDGKWGRASSQLFEARAISFLHLLGEFPEMGLLEVPEKGIRAFQITSQTRVFYRIKGNSVLLLAFFDVRQHPQKKGL